MYEKTARGHAYLYLVESERERGRVRQRITRALGRNNNVPLGAVNWSVWPLRWRGCH